MRTKNVFLLFCLWLCCGGNLLAAKDTLVIISPHRKSLQQEFIPAFEKHYQATYGSPIAVDWIDQGGTENDLRYVRSKFARNSKSAQIDIFWGGGDITFQDLANEGLLQPHPLSPALEAELPAKAAGISLRSAQGHWYATAMSSFGIFYNKKLLSMLKQAEPQSWRDLGDPRYLDYLSLADPRHSSSSLVMNIIMLQALGWDKGWQLLAAIAGNAPKFTHSSSDPIKAVVSGEATVATAIDFYAYAKIASLGSNNLGFALPPGETIFNSDPVALLKGAPHEKEGRRFIDFVLSAQAQKLLILPKGHKDGPKEADIGRLAINSRAYLETEGQRITPLNPFHLPAPSFQLDLEKVNRLKQLTSDLIGAIHIAPHTALKEAWRAIIRHGNDPKLVQQFAAPPVSEAEMLQLASKWHNNGLRNQMINQWTTGAQAKYLKISQELGKKTVHNH